MAEPSAIQAQPLGCIKIARQLETALLKSLTFGGHIILAIPVQTPF